MLTAYGIAAIVFAILFACALYLLRQARAEADAARAELAQTRERAETLSNKLAAAEAQKAALEEKLASQHEETERTRADLQKDFKLLAERIFKEAQAELSQANGAQMQANREQIELTLKPLREHLEGYQKAANQNRETDLAARAKFEEQIRLMGELNARMNDEAAALTRALKGGNKIAGNWGEMALEQLLQSCGLIKGESYRMQVASQAEGGDRQLPDAVVTLPDNRHIVIDSKVSLKSYVEYCNAPNETQAAAPLEAFVDSVKKHIKDLSGKDYAALENLKPNPDFVFLFIPVEGALYELMRAEKEICNYALQKKIILVGPANLLPVLKTVELIWRSKKQDDNVRKIADAGSRVCDEIEKFLAKFQSIGTAIDSAKKAYCAAEDKLYNASRNTLKKAAEDLAKLGARAQKHIVYRSKNAEADGGEPPASPDGGGGQDA